MMWLVRIRWIALTGVLLATIVARFLGVQGIAYPVLHAAVVGGILYNALFHRILKRRPSLLAEPLLQVLADFGALTVVLWASGGVRNPFISLYFVHVLLVTLLGGRRAFLLACTWALTFAAFLLAGEAWPALQISTLDLDDNTSVFLSAAAFAVTVVGSAFVADRSQAELLRRKREAEQEGRARQRNAEILLAALDRLDVGVDILLPNGTPSFRNRHLQERHAFPLPCPTTSHGCEPLGGRCPLENAHHGKQGSCRFSVRDRGGRERVIEMHAFPLSDEPPTSVLRLHIDRTESFLAERRLLFAERLASLGRTVQAVAHELNTPLATIQTLAVDMQAALQDLPPSDEALAADLDESLALILDEMRRCRSITQGLLAGRDRLAGGSSHGPSALEPAIERAATLVFGTGQAKQVLRIDPRVRDASVAMDNDSLVQIFVNLLQNAADAVADRPGGKVHVRVDDTSGALLRVSVDDDGPGFPLGVEDRLFEPFFTTKPPGKGTGLGLYTVQSLLREAGGGLDLGCSPDGGARVTLDLPRGAVA